MEIKNTSKFNWDDANDIKRLDIKLDDYDSRVIAYYFSEEKTFHVHLELLGVDFSNCEYFEDTINGGSPVTDLAQLDTLVFDELNAQISLLKEFIASVDKLKAEHNSSKQ